MNLSTPLKDVSPSLHGDVLTVLARAQGPLTGREISRRIAARGSQEGVRKVLRALTDAGLVRRDDQPPATLYSLNQDHLAVPHVLALARLREELFRRLRGLIAEWEIQPVSAVVFGSVARGDAHLGSDVDILFIRDVDHWDPTWSRQCSAIDRSVFAWTGNYVGGIEYNSREWEHTQEIEDPLADEILRDGVTVAGVTPRELLRRYRESRRQAP
ncbi:MAG: nucleotidyltransferase domain-containing protein [Micromonosporaceae bacterium]